MRIFLAGASGVIGVRLIPLLVRDGHEVAGMTRSSGKTAKLRELGAEPVVCDVFDAGALAQAVTAFGPELVMHQLTDLPDQADQIAGFAARNNRMRTEGTRNLLAPACAAGKPSPSTSGWCSPPEASCSGTGPSTVPAPTPDPARSRRRRGSTLTRPPAVRSRC